MLKGERAGRETLYDLDEVRLMLSTDTVTEGFTPIKEIAKLLNMKRGTVQNRLKGSSLECVAAHGQRYYKLDDVGMMFSKKPVIERTVKAKRIKADKPAAIVVPVAVSKPVVKTVCDTCYISIKDDGKAVYCLHYPCEKVSV